MAEDNRGWTGLGRTADVLGILGFFGLTFGVIVGSCSGPTDQAGGDRSGTTTEPAAPSSAPAGSTGVDAPASVVPSGSAPRRTLLSELPKVDDSNDIDLEFTDVRIHGDTYQNSLYYYCDLYCEGDSPATYEVDLGGDYALFAAYAGITGTGADHPTRIEIDVDGRQARTYLVTVRKPAEVRVPVRGAQRLRITMYAPAPLTSPLEAGADAAGGVDNVFPNVALGRPVLTP